MKQGTQNFLNIQILKCHALRISFLLKQGDPNKTEGCKI